VLADEDKLQDQSMTSPLQTCDMRHRGAELGRHGRQGPGAEAHRGRGALLGTPNINELLVTQRTLEPVCDVLRSTSIDARST